MRVYDLCRPDKLGMHICKCMYSCGCIFSFIWSSLIKMWTEAQTVSLLPPMTGNMFRFNVFYRASICESDLGSRNSVRLSVRLSHAWIVTKLNDALQIFLCHTKGQSLCYSDTNSGWWAMPPSLWNLRSKWPTPFEKRRLRQISAYNVSTVGDSEKSSITTNIKLTTGFPTSHRWSAYITPKCPKGWLKERFFRFMSKGQRLVVSSAVNLVRRSLS